MLLLILAIAEASAPPRTTAVQAQAVVRVQRPVMVTAETWNRLPPGARRELVTLDEQGRPVLLRLIEQQ